MSNWIIWQGSRARRTELSIVLSPVQNDDSWVKFGNQASKGAQGERRDYLAMCDIVTQRHGTKKMQRLKAILILVLLLAFPRLVVAQNWASKMFAASTHDFGVVARGAKAEFRFEFENKYKEPVHVHSVSTSCKCTSPSVTKDWISTHEKSDIVCKFNTESFTGQRSADITVRFDKPYWAEVKLRVTGIIRGDIFFEPGIIEFGQVEQSSAPAKTVRVSHQGNSNWKISDVKSTCPYVKVQLKELFRGQGVVNYELTAQLTEGAEPGYLQNELILYVNQTQGRNSAISDTRVPIAFTANVTSALEISPAIVKLGPLKPDDSATTKVVVKSKVPFAITDIVCDDGNFSCKSNESAGGRLHLLELSYEAKDVVEGEIKNTIKILTDLKNKPEIELPVFVIISK